MTKSVRYELIIYWSEEDNAFIAEVPELPGCVADGATYTEAVANVEVIIQEWLETVKELGRDIPQPKGRLVSLVLGGSSPPSRYTISRGW